CSRRGVRRASQINPTSAKVSTNVSPLRSTPGRLGMTGMTHSKAGGRTRKQPRTPEASQTLPRATPGASGPALHQNDAEQRDPRHDPDGEKRYRDDHAQDSEVCQNVERAQKRREAQSPEAWEGMCALAHLSPWGVRESGGAASARVAAQRARE